MSTNTRAETTDTTTFADMVRVLAEDIAADDTAQMDVWLSTGGKITGRPAMLDNDDFLTLRTDRSSDVPSFVNLAHVVRVVWSDGHH